MASRWFIYIRRRFIDMTDSTGGWEPLPAHLYGPYLSLELAVEWLEENSWGYRLTKYDKNYWVYKRHPDWHVYTFPNTDWDYRFVELPCRSVPDGLWKVGELVNHHA